VGRNLISAKEADFMFVATDLFAQNYGVNPVPVVDDNDMWPSAIVADLMLDYHNKAI